MLSVKHFDPKLEKILGTLALSALVFVYLLPRANGGAATAAFSILMHRVAVQS